MTRYPLDSLSREVAFLAYYLHWPLGELMELSHLERHRWLREVSRINEEVNDSDETDGGGRW